MMSRYGIRQWAAPLPSTRIVIKDPFAVLSLAAIHQETGAVPLVVYRHPAAVLASYRRVGWVADTEEIVALGAPPPRADGDLEAMAAMWRWCHQIALSDLTRVKGAVVVSHQRLAAGGPVALLALGERLGLDLAIPSKADDRLTARATTRREGVLHDFARSAGDLESGWRRALDPDEITTMERLVGEVWLELEGRQLSLPAADAGGRRG